MSARNPIFWTSTNFGENNVDRQTSRMVNGKRVTDRHPQVGHENEHGEAKKRARGIRYVDLIDHHGHEIHHCLTNAAAHLQHTDPYGQQAMAKARHFGWFQPRMCPCALLATGELTADKIVSPEVRIGTPCAPGTYSYTNQCPHSVAEQAARKAQNKAVQDAREAKSVGREDKLIDAVREQTAAAVKQTAALADVVLGRIEAAAAPKDKK